MYESLRKIEENKKFIYGTVLFLHKKVIEKIKIKLRYP